MPVTHRLRRLIRSPKFSLRIWGHRLLFWGGAVLVALAAMLFERTSTFGNHLFTQAIALYPVLAFVITPLGFAGVLWLTRRVFPGAQGSGIPQTIAALKIPVLADRQTVLSLRLAVGKVLMTSLGLCVGASVGREGPTVQVGAAIMHALGRWIRLPIQDIDRTLILAGGAAGIAAAFNTPLAGIVFAIEELSRSFEERTSGTVLTTVIVSGITAMAVAGNYTYFGHTDAVLDLAAAWRPVLICGVGGGLLGGLFARILIAVSLGLPGRPGDLIKDHPYAFAALCGLGMALLGLLSGNSIYGTGYEEAKGLIEGKSALPATFGLMKLAATVLSYVSGIPGGIFAPSLAVGAGLGADLAPFLPGVPIGALAILGMVGYFTGVVQAPITAVVIVMEMTDNQSLTLPLMAAAMIAFGVSRLVCPDPMYRTLAKSFIERGVRREHRPDGV
ncbi:MAG: chloride channel protein [Rhodospirillales bacterium]|nr:MAG: chloride channel protein [Rhodospirillales bacterium]